MSRIGTLKVQGADETYDIGIFEPGDLDYEPLRIACENGIGVIPLTDPPGADTPLRIQTDSRGVQAINTGLLYQLIDDFEHNALDSHYGIADTSNPAEIRQEAARSGTYGLYGYSDARVMSLPSWHSDYESSTQPQTLDYYPSSDDIFEFYVYVQDILVGGTAINRFHFAKQDYQESSDGYRIWWSFNADYWRIERRINGNGTTFAEGNVSWPFREWLRGVVDWRGSGFEATMYRENGAEIDSLSTTDTTYTSGGIGYDNGQYTVSYTDDWRILPNPD